MLFRSACDNTLTHESPTLFLNSPIHTIGEEICFDDTMPPIYDDYYDECDIFSPLTIEEKIYCVYTMPPIYDGYDSFTPTITNEKDFTYVESNDNNCMHVDFCKNFYCDSYIIKFAYDATESYYERVKHGSKY